MTTDKEELEALRDEVDRIVKAIMANTIYSSAIQFPKEIQLTSVDEKNMELAQTINGKIAQYKPLLDFVITVGLLREEYKKDTKDPETALNNAIIKGVVMPLREAVMKDVAKNDFSAAYKNARLLPELDAADAGAAYEKEMGMRKRAVSAVSDDIKNCKSPVKREIDQPLSQAEKLLLAKYHVIQKESELLDIISSFDKATMGSIQEQPDTEGANPKLQQAQLALLAAKIDYQKTLCEIKKENISGFSSIFSSTKTLSENLSNLNALSIAAGELKKSLESGSAVGEITVPTLVGKSPELVALHAELTKIMENSCQALPLYLKR